MKIKLSPKETYECEVPENPSIEEVEVFANKLLRIVKFASKDPIGMTPIPKPRGKWKDFTKEQAIELVTKWKNTSDKITVMQEYGISSKPTAYNLIQNLTKKFNITEKDWNGGVSK